MTYYNQNNYAHVPYPRPSDPKANVKSGGCGVCCGSTVLSFFGLNWAPDKLAPIFIAQGARADTGTNMRLACNIIAELADVHVTTISLEPELVKCLRAGGIAIANVDGDAGEKGVFSNAGHYIVVVGVKDNGDLLIYDVGDYASKYASAYRAARVKREGELLVCSQATLDMDTKHRTPNYYLFWPKEDKPMTPETHTPAPWAKDAWEAATAAGILDGTYPQGPVTREQLAVILHRLGLVK